eukprot:NODE_25764_length_576_cov_1.748330.p4 GENE.NODE_25764_length_576_cov_1.748330~~NODE_25764_length_576_cov_1.748330.p4  ORF type:complete len:54 (+),score=1.34 NODE_25764_length_576_cov_1.748330:291-452(+)
MLMIMVTEAFQKMRRHSSNRQSTRSVWHRELPAGHRHCLDAFRALARLPCLQP